MRPRTVRTTPLIGGVLLALLAVMVWTPVYARPGSDPVSRVEAYLDQIRAKINNIQQSVDGIEEPPISEQIVDAYSLSACASLDALLSASLNASVTEPIEVDGQAEPGAAVISGLLEALVQLNGSVSGSVSAGATSSIIVCLDLWKLAKILLDQAQTTNGQGPSGLLDQVSDDVKDYVMALAEANPAGAFNHMLDRADAFGFDPVTLTTVAEQFETQVLNTDIPSTSITDPASIFTDVEQRLGSLASTLPFAGDLTTSLSSVFNDPERLNPCNLDSSNLPINQMGAIIDASCSSIGSLDTELATIVDVLDNLFDLETIEQALNATHGILLNVRDNILTAMNDLLDDLEGAKNSFCENISDSVFHCS